MSIYRNLRANKNNYFHVMDSSYEINRASVFVFFSMTFLRKSWEKQSLCDVNWIITYFIELLRFFVIRFCWASRVKRNCIGTIWPYLLCFSYRQGIKFTYPLSIFYKLSIFFYLEEDFYCIILLCNCDEIEVVVAHDVINIMKVIIKQKFYS